MTTRLTGDRLPCWGTGPGTLQPELSDGNPGSCVPLFLKGKLVRRFQADIILPPGRMTIYQIGVVTNGHVDCDDPMMVVMSEAVDCDDPFRHQFQCSRKPQHDRGKPNTCVFQCFSHELNDFKVTVAVQFNKKPWINDSGDKQWVCEIEAYIFWYFPKRLWKYDLKFDIVRLSEL